RTARRVRDGAAHGRLPLELALYIAVEAERALAEASSATGLDRDRLIEFLDTAAADRREDGPRHMLVRPLEEYARALRRGLSDPVVDDTTLQVRVPHRVAAAWAHSAAEAGLPLERWVADTVEAANGDRKAWEAAASARARTLAEWVLLQAA